MKDLLHISSLLLSLLVSSVLGVNIPFKRVVTKATFGVSKTTLGAAVATGSNSDNIANFGDVRYTATISLNGKDVIVALDTGSSDLWVYPPNGLGTFNDTHVHSGVAYGDGSYGVNGTIGVAPFSFGQYTVEKQAFLNVTEISLSGIVDLGISGLMGLSFNGPLVSNIDGAILSKFGPTATWGASVLTNIFAQNPSSPNLIAFYLTRTEDLEDTAGGSFDIGEYDPRFASIQNAPKLSQYPPGSESWQTILDGIVVDGNGIGVSSGVKGVAKGKAVAVLDTGTPTSAFSTDTVNEIYGRVPGAVNDVNNNGWILPCNATTIVEFIFGGQSFAMHPLDLSNPQQLTVSGQNYTACLGSFLGIDGWSSQYDILLGDSFLRNVYSVYDFGDTNTQTQSTGTPYMQLLSETDPATAGAQAVTTRAQTLASMAPELPPSQLLKLLQAEEAGSTSAQVDLTSSPSGSDVSTVNLKDYALIIIGLLAANIVIGLALLILGVVGCVRRGGKTGGKPARYAPVPVKLETGHGIARDGRYDATPYD